MKYLFYLLPGLLNVVIGMFFFISSKRFADAGASALAATSTMAVWAFIYAICSFASGKFATRHNTVKILFFSQIVLLISMLGMILLPNLTMQYIWLFLSGIGTGLFFAPFQVVVKLFEKQEISLETFARSSAIYTFSWSFGQGVGPLIAGVVWGMFVESNGWQYCYMINVAIIVFVLASLCFMQKFVNRKLASEPAEASTLPVQTSENTNVPDIMKAIWFLCAGTLLAVAVLRSYLPSYATRELHISTTSQGIMLALISIVQAVTALCCMKVKSWPFRPYAGLTGAVLAVVSLVMFAYAYNVAVAWSAAVMFGLFAGVTFFNLTYHALANASKSARYAAVNETLVGSMSVFAPLGAGLVADHTTLQMPFYILITAIIITVTIYSRMTWQYRNYGK